MSSVACWKIPNCNSHHATSSLQYLLFKTKQNVSVFTNVLAIHSEARQPFVLTNRSDFKRSFPYVKMNLPQFVCTPVFPECNVFHWISRTCLTTLCLLVSSHSFVFAKIVIASAAAAVCCIIIVPLCETTITQTRGARGSQYLCCLSKTQSRVKSATGKCLCHHSPFILVVKNISAWGPFLRFALLLKSFSKCT